MDRPASAREGMKAQADQTPLPKTSLDITVLMGGPSNERQISLLSGTAIADGLDTVGHRVTRADITPQDTSALDRKDIDVVFIALHGEFGESGEVQALCDERGLRYTGSNGRASRIGMDKAASKQLIKRTGLATPDWMIIEEFHEPDQVSEWLDELAPPVVLKPVDGGSSVDITIAADTAQRDKALEFLLDKYGRAMLERFVPGREFTVSILGSRPLPLLEIISGGDFYDYQSKYDDDAGTQYVFDHGLEGEIVKRMQADALKVHRVLGCRHLSRVDFILDLNGTSYVLELNTIPGFTIHSLLPKAAAHAGISFPELVDRIVALAVRG
ncbi:MAG: D-alanine--D-alanine ligase [Phycisphaerae bacterium]|nr:D-alanine--D-alanine ligase [Phycisphaerae bacterium]